MAIKAVFENIDLASGGVAKSAENVRNLLDQLGRDLAPLMNDWGGTAQTLYREKQAQWDKLAVELQEIQQLIAKHLSDSANSYRETDLICSRAWS